MHRTTTHLDGVSEHMRRVLVIREFVVNFYKDQKETFLYAADKTKVTPAKKTAEVRFQLPSLLENTTNKN